MVGDKPLTWGSVSASHVVLGASEMPLSGCAWRSCLSRRPHSRFVPGGRRGGLPSRGGVTLCVRAPCCGIISLSPT